MKTKVTTLFLCLSLASCMNLERIKKTNIGNISNYNNALAKNYRILAEREERDYDWFSAEMFAKKGMKAARGEMVQPTNLDRWKWRDISYTKKMELKHARDALVSVLTPETKIGHPVAAADALASFDCWVEEQNEGWQHNRISTCKENYMRAMHELTNSGCYKTHNHHVVYFNTNSSRIGTIDDHKIKHVAMIFKNGFHKNHKILVTGHADTSGSHQMNHMMAAKRAEAVKAALIKHGVCPTKIIVQDFGAHKLAHPTKDEVKNVHNRRVDISIVE
jgi:OOP family OmpA-OmpF porin